jgi:hypothetical protein
MEIVMLFDTRVPVPNDIVWPKHGGRASIIDSDGRRHRNQLVTHVHDRMPASMLQFDSEEARAAYPEPHTVEVHFESGIETPMPGGGSYGGRIWCARRFPFMGGGWAWY